jgi:hypothetical protein
MTFFATRSAVLIGLGLLLQSEARAQSHSASAAEHAYVRQLVAYEAMFKWPTPFGDTALKVELRDVRDLESKLRPIARPLERSDLVPTMSTDRKPSAPSSLRKFEDADRKAA